MAQRSSKTSMEAEAWTDEERAAMKERAQELKAARRRRPDDEDGEVAVREKMAGLPEPDRALAERLHAIIMGAAPDLTPRLWYGMPAYAKDGQVICHFQNAQKFKMRYATLGFSDKAKLDEGRMWPCAYALTELTAADEARIVDLVKQAVR